MDQISPTHSVTTKVHGLDMENAPHQKKLFCDYQDCRRNKAQVFHGVVIVLITKDLQKWR